MRERRGVQNCAICDDDRILENVYRTQRINTMRQSPASEAVSRSGEENVTYYRLQVRAKERVDHVLRPSPIHQQRQQSSSYLQQREPTKTTQPQRERAEMEAVDEHHSRSLLCRAPSPTSRIQQRQLSRRLCRSERIPGRNF